MELWPEWLMMNRLHCTYNELREEPFEEMCIFQAFAAGESDAQRDIASQN